jgi:hypothetical protein
MLDPETEEIVALSDKISALGAADGVTNTVMMRAALNICAAAIVSGCHTCEEAERVADQLSRDLAKGVRDYWSAKHPH